MQFEIGIVTWICCMQHLYRPEYMFYTCFIFNKPIVWTIKLKVTDRYFFSISMHYIAYLKHNTLFMFLYISSVNFFLFIWQTISEQLSYNPYLSDILYSQKKAMTYIETINYATGSVNWKFQGYSTDDSMRFNSFLIDDNKTVDDHRMLLLTRITLTLFHFTL